MLLEMLPEAMMNFKFYTLYNIQGTGIKLCIKIKGKKSFFIVKNVSIKIFTHSNCRRHTNCACSINPARKPLVRRNRTRNRSPSCDRRCRSWSCPLRGVRSGSASSPSSSWCSGLYTVLCIWVAYILYLRNPRVYSNSPSVLGCFTDSVCFLDFWLRDIIFS
jgi:hypothetical protein